jgi:NitT/TauT family transport system permease protein
VRTLEPGLVERLARRVSLGTVVTPRALRVATTVAVVAVVWQLASVFFFKPTVLPSLVAVVGQFFEILEVGDVRGRSALYHLEITLVRVAIVTVISMTAAVVFGLLMDAFEEVEDMFTLLIPFWMTFPTVVVVLVTMIMFDFSQLSVISATVIITTPYAAVAIWEGMENLEYDLVEMGRAFGASTYEMYRHIYLPNLLPAFFSSFRYLFSMVWKIVVIAEVFGIRSGMGAQFRFWFSESSMIMLLAYAMLFLVVMFVLEFGLIYPIEKWAFRWRN